MERCAATSADDGGLLVPSTVPSVGRCVFAARAASAGRNREGGVLLVVLMVVGSGEGIVIPVIDTANSQWKRLRVPAVFF